MDSLDQQTTAQGVEAAKLLPEVESQAVDRTASAEELYELVYGQPSDRPAGAALKKLRVAEDPASCSLCAGTCKVARGACESPLCDFRPN